MTTLPSQSAAIAGMPTFRVEVSGMWHEPPAGEEVLRTEVFLVAAPGPRAAEIAGSQLFGTAAARQMLVASAARSARVLADGAQVQPPPA